MKAAGGSFLPDCLEGVKGTLKLTVKNTGTQKHSFTAKSLDIHEDIEPGKAISVEVSVGKKPVEFVCVYHVQTMYGSISS